MQEVIDICRLILEARREGSNDVAEYLCKMLGIGDDSAIDTEVDVPEKTQPQLSNCVKLAITYLDCNFKYMPNMSFSTGLKFTRNKIAEHLNNLDEFFSFKEIDDAIELWAKQHNPAIDWDTIVQYNQELEENVLEGVVYTNASKISGLQSPAKKIQTPNQGIDYVAEYLNNMYHLQLGDVTVYTPISKIKQSIDFYCVRNNLPLTNSEAMQAILVWFQNNFKDVKSLEPYTSYDFGDESPVLYGVSPL
jgi:hypothetical protein